MPVRIPTDASPQLQEALRGIEQRLAALEKQAGQQQPSAAASTLTKLTERLAAVEDVAKPAYGDEWKEMVAAGPQHQRGLTPDPAANAGLGTERVLHENGTWRRALDGLVQVIPEGIGRPTHAARVLEVLADLAVAGSIGATEGHFKALNVNGQPALLPAPGAGLRFATDTARAASGYWEKVLFTTAIEDNASIADTVNSRLICRTAGVYRVAWALYGIAAATLARGGFVYKNGSALGNPGSYGILYGTPGGAYTINGFAEPVRLAVNDYIELYDYTDQSVTYAAATCFLSIQHVRP